MVLPILISPSLAPGPYCFCAAAGPAASARPNAAQTMRCLSAMVSSFQGGECGVSPSRGVPAAAAREALPGQVERARDAGGHHVHEEDHQRAVDRPWRRLRDLVGQVGHELDE